MFIRLEKTGNNQLINAYKENDIDRFKSLIEDGHNINCLDIDSLGLINARSLINIVIKNSNSLPSSRNRKFFNLLLSSDVFLGKVCVKTPLSVSIIDQKDIYYMKKLLNINDINKNRIIHPKNDAEFPISVLIDCILYGDSEKINLILKKTNAFKLILKTNYPILNILMWGKMSNICDLAQKFINMGAKIDQVDNITELQPIHTWSRSYSPIEINEKLLDVLLKNGASINVQCKCKASPAMHAALSYNMRKLMLLIKKGADLSIVDSAGSNIAHYMANMERYKLNQFIEVFEKCPNLLLVENNKGITPLAILEKSTNRNRLFFSLKKWISQNT